MNDVGCAFVQMNVLTPLRALGLVLTLVVGLAAFGLLWMVRRRAAPSVAAYGTRDVSAETVGQDDLPPRWRAS